MTLVYQSTRDAKNTVTASQAILQGLATDGGLFTPVSYPKVDLDFETLKDASYQEVAGIGQFSKDLLAIAEKGLEMRGQQEMIYLEPLKEELTI